MPIKRLLPIKIQRKLRLILSDFFHLIMAPGYKGVYTWKQIVLPIFILIFVVVVLVLAQIHKL